MIFSIVIPAFNEEGSIEEICKRVLHTREDILRQMRDISDVECIVVDDGSQDRTLEILSRFKNIKVIHHETNGGYGAALKDGFRTARGDYIAFLDADGTYPPEFLPELLKVSLENNADIALGSRLNGQRNGMPLQRYIGNKFFAWLLSWIVNQKISDTASGMRVVKKAALKRLYPLPDGLDLTPAMSTRALHENLKIIEIPMPYEERVGASKLNAVVDGFRFLNTILKIARLYNPLKFFGAIGLLLILFAGMLSIKPIHHLLAYGSMEQITPYRFFAIMVSLLAGMNIVHFGAFSNNVLALLHGRKPNGHDFWQKYIFKERIMATLDRVGLVLILLAFVLNVAPLMTYLQTRSITVSWPYIFGTVLLFLMGLQLFMGTFLIKIIAELREQKLLTRRRKGQL